MGAGAPPSTWPLNQKGQNALWVTADNPFNSCCRPSVTSVSAAQPRPADTFYKALNSRLFTGCQSYRPFKSISANRLGREGEGLGGARQGGGRVGPSGSGPAVFFMCSSEALTSTSGGGEHTHTHTQQKTNNETQHNLPVR